MITPDQPLPTETAADNEVVLQHAVNALTTALRGNIHKAGGIDMVENEITTRLMFFHVHALTNMLIEKGLIEEGSVQKALIKAFTDQAALLSGPKIVLSR